MWRGYLGDLHGKKEEKSGGQGIGLGNLPQGSMGHPSSDIGPYNYYINTYSNNYEESVK